jgi:hypothetical protein
VLVDAGIAKPPILDWFHIAMRLQHAAQSAGALATDDPARAKAKARIVAEVERLRWRIWNGKAKNAKRSLDRVRKVMHVYRGERGDYAKSAPSRRLWHALHNVDKTSEARATGSSITLSDIELAGASEVRSPKAPPTSSSTGA